MIGYGALAALRDARFVAIDRLLAAQSAAPLASPSPHARRYAANTRRAPKANAN